ncbi:spore germination protein GerPC [Ornithinibacillus salinisoli]|uniref:Spore germination protein GerPC n=1 Tax=Ornithinibacillus salinisoli TaxID=1848459 RepID=A0ABW4VSV1_9BACI
MNIYDWNYYLYELQQANQQQQNQLRELQERINKLESMVQEKNSHMVERVEYHFDQLKIERLDGTLHIGLSPSDLANIDDLGLGNNQFTSNNANPNSNSNSTQQKIMTDLTNFLHQDGPNMIQNLANEYQCPIEVQYQSMLIQDMEKQLPQRIGYYTDEAKQHRDSLTDEELHNYVCDKVKKEIYHSLAKYMQGNSEKGE